MEIKIIYNCPICNICSENNICNQLDCGDWVKKYKNSKTWINNGNEEDNNSISGCYMSIGKLRQLGLIILKDQKGVCDEENNR